MSLSHLRSEAPEELYTDKDDDHVMVQFVNLLNKRLGERKINCVRTHTSLILLAEEDTLSGRVGITANFKSGQLHGIEILCRMPERIEPWPNAWIQSIESNVEDAVEKTLLAIDYSEAWPP